MPPELWRLERVGKTHASATHVAPTLGLSHKEDIMDMSTSEATVAVAEPNLRERVADAGRRAVQVANDARALKSVASDALEDGLYTVRRAVKTATRDLADVRDEASYRIKKAPMQAVGVAFGAGLCLGIAAGAVAWVAGRPWRRAVA